MTLKAAQFFNLLLVTLVFGTFFGKRKIGRVILGIHPVITNAKGG